MSVSNSRFWLHVAIFTAIIGVIVAIFGSVMKCEAAEITWHQLNEARVAWDAVTKLTDGSDVPEGDLVRYKVFVAEPEKKDEKFELGETELLEFKVGIPKEGKFYAGVQALRYRLIDEELTELSRSIISWSDEPECTNNNPFGVVFYFKMTAPLNLRKAED